MPLYTFLVSDKPTLILNSQSWATADGERIGLAVVRGDKFWDTRIRMSTAEDLALLAGGEIEVVEVAK